MIKVGIAGVGFMGWIHYLAYGESEGISIAAVADEREGRLRGDWSDIKGNFGPPGRQVDLSGIKTYRELDEMLADPDLDMIDVCLPPSLHAPTAVTALNSGKHVFCEKPMALTTEDCDAMVTAANQSGKQLLIGHVLPMYPEYAFALRTVRDGQYGKLIGGQFKRIISDPDWLPDYYNLNRVGGPLIDLHVHDAHLIRLLYGMPTSLTSVGTMRGEVVDFCNTQFQFADQNLVVGATSGVINQQGRPFVHGFEIYLERATLLFEFAVIGGEAVTVQPLTLLDDQGQAVQPPLGDGDPLRAFEAEIREVTQCLEQGKPSSVLSGRLARDAIVLCHKQAESVESGNSVQVPG